MPILFTCRHPMVVDGIEHHEGCGDLEVGFGRVRLLKVVDHADGGTTKWAVIGCPNCGAPTARDLDDRQYQALSGAGAQLLAPTMASRVGELVGVPMAWDRLVATGPDQAELDRAFDGELVAELERHLAKY